MNSVFYKGAMLLYLQKLIILSGSKEEIIFRQSATKGYYCGPVTFHKEHTSIKPICCYESKGTVLRFIFCCVGWRIWKENNQ